jgi:Uma2 family endonuclease
MISPDLRLPLPSTDELPCSDDTPVDNEDQNLLPNVLLFLLNTIWANRMDWYFGVDMAVYHAGEGFNPRVPVVPDAFLSLNVERRKGGRSRRSYATWEENDVVPILTLEMVSHKLGGEYDEKMKLYADLGVLYYVIYNPEFWQRDRHQPFEVYKLIQDHYQLQIGEPFWMPEVGLGIGRCQQVMGGIQQEQLSWFNAQGQRYPAPDDVIQQTQEQLKIQQQQTETAQQQAVAARQRAEELAQYLRSLGVDPDNLPQV